MGNLGGRAGLSDTGSRSSYSIAAVNIRINTSTALDAIAEQVEGSHL